MAIRLVAGCAAMALALAGCGVPALPPTDLPPSWGGMPLLDLAADSTRQVVLDREARQYLGHPTTHLLPDGKTIIAVYPKGHGAGAIVMKRSTDGGLTWGERLPTPSSWATSREVPTLFHVDRADGSQRLLLFSGLYPIRLSRSDDAGETWSELEPIGDFGGIVAMASLERLRDGRLMAFFHDDGRFIDAQPRPEPRVFTVYVTESGDDGLTWSAPRVIAEDDSLDLCEPGIVRSPDGGSLAMLLRENRRVATSQIMVSVDEGANWSPPRPLPPSLTGDRHVGIYLPDGRLAVSFRDMAADSPTKGDWLLWVGTWDEMTSGVPGGYRVRLMDNRDSWDSTYPALERLPDGTIVATTYGHWTAGEEPWIATVRFTAGELDALMARLPAPDVAVAGQAP